MKMHMRPLSFLILCGLGGFFGMAYTAQAQDIQSAIQGSVDSLKVEGNTITVQGWAAARDSGQNVTSISIWLADTLVYEGRFAQTDRRDVAKKMGRNDWRKSGWQIHAELPKNHASGKFPIKVQAKLETGSIETLQLSPFVAKLIVDEAHQFSVDKISKTKVQLMQLTADKKLKARAVLILLLSMVCLVFLKADPLAGWLTGKSGYLITPPVLFSAALFVAFIGLLGLGVTGSSLGIGVKGTPFVQSDEINIWGQDQPIRSDEWLVGTPYNIAQHNHHPRLPIINKNVGTDGQNMLIVMGAPVAHISSIAKPITWGFFVFDLKRALSWYWYFPIFACLLALWGVLALILPGQWKFSFLISFWFCVSPFVAAWSNAPTNTVFFPSISLLAAVAILKSRSHSLPLVLGCILGISLSGFVLLLYPPWQVSLGYVFLALAIGIVVRDKLYRNLSTVKLISFGLAIVITGLILWSWWSDAHLAIQALSSTVYPGERILEVGGGMTLPNLLRGFTNLVTLYKIEGLYSNKSEIASFCYLLLPLAVLFVYRWHKKEIGAVEVAVAAVMLFILWFMLIGIPRDIAEFSLWGRVPAKRADIALGLSYIFLCGMLLSPRLSTIVGKDLNRGLALGASFIWAAVALNAVSNLNSDILIGFSPGIVTGLFLIFVAVGYWLTMGKYREFIAFNVLISLTTIVWFNPVNIAPKSITPSPAIVELTGYLTGSASKKRVLVLESYTPAMYLLASGIPVANGVFFIPQRSLWEKLDKEHMESKKYNRFQHLVFTGGVVDSNDNYRIDSPHGDTVRVTVDLERFDFRKTDADLVAAPVSENGLHKNESLSYVKSEKGYLWFRIVGT
jgi:hypothetical protein